MIEKWPDIIDETNIVSGIRKRKPRGFKVQSDNDDSCSESDIEESTFRYICDSDNEGSDFKDDSIIPIPPFYESIPDGWGWIAANVLPVSVYDLSASVENDLRSVTSTMSRAESTVAAFSLYRDLREAEEDADFDRVLKKLHSEWNICGASVSPKSSCV